MKPPAWNVRRHHGRFSIGRVVVTGPGIDDLAYDIACTLGDATWAHDDLAGAWADFSGARAALAKHQREGYCDDELEEQLRQEAAASWEQLVPDLAAQLSLHVAEAHQLAHVLGEQTRGVRPTLARWLRPPTGAIRRRIGRRLAAAARTAP